VGKRNLRVFILLLISAALFYLLSAVVAGLALFYEPETTREVFWEIDWALIVNFICIGFQLIKIIVLCCLTSCIPFNTALAIFVFEAVISLGLAISTFNYETILSAPMMSLGLTFLLFVWPLLTKHMNFIAHHLTEKEFHARLEVMNKLQMEDAMIKSVGCRQKCHNLCLFFCRRKVPSSEIL